MAKKVISTFEREMKDPAFKKQYEKECKDLLISDLSEADQNVFLDALKNPPTPNKKLRSAAKRYQEERQK